jgi:transcriptional regulator with XRE-family HTH domain
VDIGKRLRELREAKGVSQDDIEARTCIPKDEVSKIDSGGDILTVPMPQGWANAIGIELHEFFASGRASAAVGEGVPADRQELALLESFRQLPVEDRALLTSLVKDMAKRTGKYQTSDW